MSFYPHTYEAAAEYMTKARNEAAGRPLENNTRLVPTSVWIDGEQIEAYGVKLHQTIVVAYLPDGRQVLNNGGWFSNVSRDRITEYSNTRIHSGYELDENGKKVTGYKRWEISQSTGITPPKVRKCRTCKGLGYSTYEKTGEYVYDGNNGNGWRSGAWVPYDEPVVIKNNCYRCQGTTEVDYGSHKRYVAFENGMVIDHNGEVVGHSGRVTDLSTQQLPQRYRDQESYTPYVPSVPRTNEEIIDSYTPPTERDFRTYVESPDTLAWDTAFSMRFSEMNAEAEAEMAEWNAIIKRRTN